MQNIYKAHLYGKTSLYKQLPNQRVQLFAYTVNMYCLIETYTIHQIIHVREKNSIKSTKL